MPWTGGSYNLKRGINIERLKAVDLFYSNELGREYGLYFQDNEFCRKYSRVNSESFHLRNENWGRKDPWKPFCFDKITDHVAYTYKLGVIYKK